MTKNKQFGFIISLCLFAFNSEAVDRILIQSIDPPISEVLEVGKDYEIKIKAKYQSTKKEGRVGMNVQRAESEYPPLCVLRKDIIGEKGLVELSCKITVVNTPSIIIFIPFYNEKGKSTSVVDGRTYETIDNRNEKCSNK